LDENCTQISFNAYTRNYSDATVLQKNKGSLKDQDKKGFIKDLKTSKFGETHKDNSPEQSQTGKFNKDQNEKLKVRDCG